MKIYIGLILIITMTACTPQRYKNIFMDYDRDQFIVGGTTNKCLKENLPWLHELIENRHILISLSDDNSDELTLYLSNKGIEKFQAKGTGKEMKECGCFKTKEDFFKVFGRTSYINDFKWLTYYLRDIQNLSKLGAIGYETTMMNAHWTKENKLLYVNILTA